MDKKEKDSICNAFDSLTVPDEITKQKILKSIVNKERKKSFRYRNFALPAAAVFMITANAVLIYNTSLANCHSTGTIYMQQLETDVSETETTTSEYIIYNSVSATEASSERELSSDTVLDLQQPAYTEITSETEKANHWKNMPETETVTEVADIENDSSDLNYEGFLPPVSAELQDLFLKAYELYRYPDLLFFDPDETDKNETMIGKDVYRPVNSEYFSTTQEAYDYFHKYFTDNCIEKLNLLSGYIEYDGRIYGLAYVKSGLKGYSGHTYKIMSRSDNETAIKITCYIAKNTDSSPDIVLPYELFFGEPDNPEDYDIIEKSIVFKKEGDNIWRIDDMELMW